ncbi:hypothetical protein K2173_020589 [Erythroxylum novogranatense]|uniref:JmjN domain-containing protein n=1 Tax=Erythroxylum novogranatense TaxID=1862640 RepID=A0AAV8TIK7_9ROSI|nr:hypothetical protein K2173_020589 [Erythroxylum novogranatense]
MTGFKAKAMGVAATRPLESEDPNYTTLKPETGHKRGWFHGRDAENCLPKGFRRTSAPSRYINYEPDSSAMCGRGKHRKETRVWNLCLEDGIIQQVSDGGAFAEVVQWLKNLPVALEYHPTPTEFQDTIAYIFKIEKEASKYGIYKIVPPILASPKETAIANLSRSLAVKNGEKSPPTFTTRQ